jgi:hypothetical protein
VEAKEYLRSCGRYIERNPVEAGLVADLAAPFGIEFPPVPDGVHERLGQILGPIVTIANPLDYVEGGAFNERRRALSEILDSTSPDLSAFARRGGKLIVAIGTNDTLASPGAQLDYYQSVIDKMGRAQVDRFARFFVMPQTGHGLSGTNYATSGDGQTGDRGSDPASPMPGGDEKHREDHQGRQDDAGVVRGIVHGAVDVCGRTHFHRLRRAAVDGQAIGRVKEVLCPGGNVTGAGSVPCAAIVWA